MACDDIPLARIYQPPIASITRDARRIGQTAARLLLERLMGEAGPETVMIPTSYIARRRSAAPRAGSTPGSRWRTRGGQRPPVLTGSSRPQAALR